MKLVMFVLVLVGAVGTSGAQELLEARITKLVEQAASEQTPPAARTVRLTLDEAVSRALENNLDIAVQQLNPQIADLDIASAQAAFSPTFDSTIGTTSRVQPSTTQLDGGQRVVSDTATYNAGLTKALKWGGASIDAAWSNNRNATTSIFSSFNPSYRSNFDVIYTQPLLRGFKIDSNRQRLQVTRLSRELSDIDLRRLITNTEAAVRSAYWDLVIASEAIAVQEQFVELAEDLITDNQARVELGTLAPIDIIQSQAEAAQRRQVLTEALQVRRTVELILKRLMVSGTDDALWEAEVVPVDRPRFDASPVNIEEAIRTALAQRTDIARSRRQLDINDINLRAARNTTLPALDVRASYTLQGLGGTQFVRSGLGGDVGSVLPGGYVDSLNQLIGNDFPAWNVSMTLSYPLGQSAAEASYARAQIQAKQTQAQIEQMELQIATEVTNAGLQIQSSLRRIEAATAARELARQQLDAEQSKFEVGASTNFFVVQAQRDLADAQRAELQTILDHQKSRIEFDRAQQTSLTQGSIIIISGGGN